MSEETKVADIFRRALAIRQENPNASLADIKTRLVGEFSGKAFPSTATLAIPEMDNIAPEEDWTAGLPIILRGIQTSDWKEVISGVALSLEQVENYPKESLREDDPRKNWRDRDKGITEAQQKNFSKWMPEDLIALAQKNSSK